MPSEPNKALASGQPVDCALPVTFRFTGRFRSAAHALLRAVTALLQLTLTPLVMHACFAQWASGWAAVCIYLVYLGIGPHALVLPLDGAGVHSCQLKLLVTACCETVAPLWTSWCSDRSTWKCWNPVCGSVVELTLVTAAACRPGMQCVPNWRPLFAGMSCVVDTADGTCVCVQACQSLQRTDQACCLRRQPQRTAHRGCGG
jgi:hypothetical protein